MEFKSKEKSFTIDESFLSESIETANSLDGTFVFEETSNEDRIDSKILSSSIAFDEPDQTNEAVSNDCSKFVINFVKGIGQLDLTEKATSTIFQLTQVLLKDVEQFCEQFIRNRKCDATESLDVAVELILSKLKRHNSTHKRNVFVEKQKEYVEPTQLRIGTHWEFKRDKATRNVMPTQAQSSYSYISPLDTVKSIFAREHVYNEYIEYNTVTKHTCEPNVYKDFCCGSTYKNIELFRDKPESLQLQLFIDGFEIASPLKTKTTIHSQVAIYMAIRNMPHRYAFNLNNIFLVCLVNENDLKKAEAGYNDVLQRIVADIQTLESSGINLNSGHNLKGTIAVRISDVI